jgi:hypothetical protein
MAARGKRKIAIVPRREGSNVSLSTVGRIPISLSAASERNQR